MNSAETLSKPNTPRKVVRGQVGPAELNYWLELRHVKKLSINEIARLAKRSSETIHRRLAPYEDTTPHAKQRFKGAALELTERVIAEANVDQALEVLDRFEVAPKRLESPTQTSIQIGFALNTGITASTGQVLDIQSLTTLTEETLSDTQKERK